MTERGWAELPDELLAKVLEMLEAAVVNLKKEGWASLGPLPRYGRCALRGRLYMMRW